MMTESSTLYQKISRFPGYVITCTKTCDKRLSWSFGKKKCEKTPSKLEKPRMAALIISPGFEAFERNCRWVFLTVFLFVCFFPWSFQKLNIYCFVLAVVFEILSHIFHMVFAWVNRSSLYHFPVSELKTPRKSERPEDRPKFSEVADLVFSPQASFRHQFPSTLLLDSDSCLWWPKKTFITLQLLSTRHVKTWKRRIKLLCKMSHLQANADSMPRCLSDSKLDEAFAAHGQSGHRFGRKSFTRPTYCHHCTDLLWGLTNQGLICEGKKAL